MTPAERILSVVEQRKLVCDNEFDRAALDALRVAVKELNQTMDDDCDYCAAANTSREALTEIAALLGCEEENHG